MNLSVEARLGIWAPGNAGPPSLTCLAKKLQCVLDPTFNFYSLLSMI